MAYQVCSWPDSTLHSVFHYSVAALVLCRLCITRTFEKPVLNPGNSWGLHIAEEVVYMLHLLSQPTALVGTPSNKRRSKSIARDDSRADTPRVAVMARAQFAADAPSPQPEAPDALAISATSLWRDDGLYELKVHTGASAGSRGNGAIGSIDNSTGGGGQLKNSCRSSNS